MSTDKRVTDLSDASLPLDPSDVLYVIQAGDSYKTTVQAVLNLGVLSVNGQTGEAAIDLKSVTDVGNSTTNEIKAAGFNVSSSDNAVRWERSSRMYSYVDGFLTLFNDLMTRFEGIQFGGTTSGQAMIRTLGNGLAIKTADDAAYSSLTLQKLFADVANFSSVTATSTDGAVWNDSTRKALTTYLNVIQQSLVGCIFTQTADKTVTNTTTETSILGTGVGTKTLPANFFVAGKTIRLRVGGVYSTPIGAPSLIIKVKYGSTIIAQVTTTALLASASNLEFDGEVLITCRTTGSSGTVMVHGDVEYSTGVTGTIAVDSLNHAGATTTINTTTSNALDVTVQWDTASSTRIAKSTVCTIEVVN